MHGYIAAVEGGTVPILALGSSPQGGTGLHGISRVPVGTQALATLAQREKFNGLVKLVQYPIPGFLLGLTGIIQARVFFTRGILVIQGFFYDGNTTVCTHIGKVVAGADEEGFTHVGILLRFVNRTLFIGILDHLHELVDSTDGLVIPETGSRVLIIRNIAGGVAEHLILVIVAHAHAREVGIEVSQQGEHTILGGLQVFGGNLAQVTFHTIEELVAGNETERESGNEDIFEYLFHFHAGLEVEVETKAVGLVNLELTTGAAAVI